MLKKIAIIIATIAAATYLVFALFYLNAPPASPKCKGLEIEISDNDTRVLSPESIEKHLREKGFRFKDTPMKKISSAEIEKVLRNMSIIEECECYKTHRDIVSIKIRCKEPIIQPTPLPSTRIEPLGTLVLDLSPFSSISITQPISPTKTLFVFMPISTAISRFLAKCLYSP